MRPRRGREPGEDGAPPSHPGPGGSQAPGGGSEQAGDRAPLLLPRGSLPRRQFVSRSFLIHRTIRMVPTAGSRARSASVRAGASRLPRRVNSPHACSLSTIRIRTGPDQFTKLTQMTRVIPALDQAIVPAAPARYRPRRIRARKPRGRLTPYGAHPTAAGAETRDAEPGSTGAAPDFSARASSQLPRITRKYSRISNDG